jgi:predicted RNA binding protein YcfA (HicA-like mRNA interferase family)
MDYSAKRLIKVLEQRGWVLKKVKGSHHHFVNLETRKIVIVPLHGNKDLAKGTFHAILKQANIPTSDI